MKTAYVMVVRSLRSVLRKIGVLGWLEKRAEHSRTALWLRSLLAVYDLDDMLRTGVPWWTFAAIDQVDAHLRGRSGSVRVLEWGSGASTVWLADRSAEVIVIEHDAAWARLMAPRLSGHVDLRVVEPVQVAVGRSPVVSSVKSGFAGLDFSAYVDEGRAVPGLFDVVVVDGRAREACLTVALEQLAADGLLVFDNVDRRRYREALEAVSDQVEVTWTRGMTPSLPYPTRTAIVRHRL